MDNLITEPPAAWLRDVMDLIEEELDNLPRVQHIGKHGVKYAR